MSDVALLLSEARGLVERREVLKARWSAARLKRAQAVLAATSAREERVGRMELAEDDHVENQGWAILRGAVAGTVDVWGGSIVFGDRGLVASKYAVAFGAVTITASPSYVYLYVDVILGRVAVGVATDLAAADDQVRVFLGKVTVVAGEVTGIDQWVFGQVLLPAWSYCDLGLTSPACVSSYGLVAAVPCAGNHSHSYRYYTGGTPSGPGDYVCYESCLNCLTEACAPCE